MSTPRTPLPPGQRARDDFPRFGATPYWERGLELGATRRR